MLQYAPDFESLTDRKLETVSLPARKVSPAIWKVLQSIQAKLVSEQIWHALPDGADPDYVRRQLQLPAALTRHGDVDEYARRRYARNKYRGQDGIRRRQLYHDPRVTLVFGGEELLGGVGTIRNTSPSKDLSYVKGVVQQHLKMHASPRVPKLGGRRYEQVTDLWFRNGPEVDQSAVALVGLHAALRSRPGGDHISLYYDKRSAAEAEMDMAKEALDLQPGGVGRYVGRIDEALDHVEALPGAHDVIASTLTLHDLPDRWRLAA